VAGRAKARLTRPCKQLDFLESQGIPSEKSEHMSALSWGILGRTPDQMAAVIDYLKGRGIKDVATTLFQNPKLLEYDVAADGKELVKGAARIQVDVTDAEGGAHNVLVNFYRVGTTFKTAPISPWKPLDA